jgi:hypothetical protein
MMQAYCTVKDLTIGETGVDSCMEEDSNQLGMEVGYLSAKVVTCNT